MAAAAASKAVADTAKKATNSVVNGATSLVKSAFTWRGLGIAGLLVIFSAAAAPAAVATAAHTAAVTNAPGVVGTLKTAADVTGAAVSNGTPVVAKSLWAKAGQFFTGAKAAVVSGAHAAGGPLTPAP